MVIKDLPRVSFDIFRKNGVISVFLFFFLMLLGCGLLLLSALLIDLSIIIVPFIIIPFFFACSIISYLMREQPLLTFKGFLRSYGAYFTSKFNSTYSVIRSFLISLAISVGFGIVYVIIINLILYNVNFMNYVEVMNDIYTHFNFTTEGIEYISVTYKAFIDHLAIISYVPTQFVLGASFLFFTSRSAVSLYPRIKSEEESGRLAMMVHQNVMKKYRKEFNKAYFYLNWPLILIYILGFSLGGYLAYTILPEYGFVSSLAIAMGAFIVLGIYGPFIVSNNEAIYLYLEEYYERETIALKSTVNQEMEKILEELNKMTQEAKNDEDGSNEN